MESYTYKFTTPKSREEIFELLLDVRQWWSGFYGETFEGKSQQLNDEFTFSAGNGMHFSKQRLVEITPNKKIVWLVTQSNLSFLSDPHEWENSKIMFALETVSNKTTITFTHQGLEPHVECYGACTNAWGQYLGNLKKTLNE